jgi:hypothetical protein
VLELFQGSKKARLAGADGCDAYATCLDGTARRDRLPASPASYEKGAGVSLGSSTVISGVAAPRVRVVKRVWRRAVDKQSVCSTCCCNGLGLGEGACKWQGVAGRRRVTCLSGAAHAYGLHPFY